MNSLVLAAIRTDGGTQPRAELRAESRRLRNSLLAECGHVCTVCGFDYSPILVVHHITPVSRGGESSKRNLTILCPTCHALAHRLWALARIRSNHPDMARQLNLKHDALDLFTRWVEDRMGFKAYDKLMTLYQLGARG